MDGERGNRKTMTRRASVGLALLWLMGMLIMRADAGSLQPQAQSESPLLEASGVIQTDEIAIASELSGRIAAIPAQEGARVEAGDVLVQLDTSLIDADIETAKAQMAIAEAGLAQARAGVAPSQIDVAEAQLARAQAGYRAACQAVTDTQALLTNPQEINLQIAVTQAQIEAAKHEVDKAIAMKDGAEFGKNQAAAFVQRFGDGQKERVQVREGELEDGLPPEIIDKLPGDLPPSDGVYTWNGWELHIEDGAYQLFQWIGFNVPTSAHLAPHYWWQSWVGVNAAMIQQEGLEETLADLYEQRAHPQTLDAQADEALRRQAEARAQVALGQAQVEGMRAGASEEELAVVEAQVAQAQTAVEALEEKRTMMTLTAPIDGTVLERILHPSEVAAQGADLLTIANLDEVTLELYIPETRLGQVYLGQTVQVTVDSFPERTFTGHVRTIANQAEFTPRNVATKEERVNLVFAVRVTIPNPDGALKPGMPADAVFKLRDQPGEGL